MAQSRLGGLRGFILALALLGSAHAVGPTLVASPKWSQLTAQDRQILSPLAAEWNALEDPSKAKWLGVAKRYPSMTPEEQERLQARMSDWAKLTPEQRTKARDQYRSMRKSPPEEREALKQKWQEYESLPPEERQRLNDKAAQPATRLPGKMAPASGAARQ